MKKLIVILAVFSMLMNITAAFGASVDVDDVVGPVTPVTTSTDDGDEGGTAAVALLLRGETTGEAAALIEKLQAAQKDAEKTPADVFPAELAMEKNAVVQEVISVILNSDYDLATSKAYTDTLSITADVSKAARVRVLIGIVSADGEDMIWFEAQEVIVEENGAALKVTYSPETVAAMKEAKSVTLVVLSVPAE